MPNCRLMAAIVSRGRLWLAVLFLFLVAGAFLVTSTLDRVKPMLAAPSTISEDQIRLAGTPFADPRLPCGTLALVEAGPAPVEKAGSGMVQLSVPLPGNLSPSVAWCGPAS